jgi:hypothetical protein
MATNGIDAPAAGQKASFTVTQAAKAFRQARNGATKVELVEGEKQYVRRDPSGRFVLVAKKTWKHKPDGRALTEPSRKR